MPEEAVPQENAVITTAITTGTTDWEKAYKTQQSNYNVLFAKFSAAQEEKTAQATQLGTLQAQLSTREAELNAQIALRETKAAETAATLVKTQADLLSAQATAMKVQALTKLDVSPAVKAGLLSLIETIPTASTPEQQAEIIKQFAAFGDTVAKTREQELRAGTTPGFAQAVAPAQTVPTTEDGFKLALKATKPGSPAYKTLSDQYFNWAKTH